MCDVSSGWCCSCEPLPSPLALSLSLWNCACARPWSTPVVPVCVLGDKYSERSVSTSTRSTHRVLAWECAAGPVTEHSVSTSECSVISLSAREVGRRKSGDSRMVVRRRGRAMRECMGVCTCARARVRVCACVCVWMYSNVPQRGAMPSAGAGAQWFYGCNGYYAHYHTGSTAKGRGSVVRPRHGAGTVANVYRCTQSEGEARQGTPRAPESGPCEYPSTRRSTH